MTLRPHIVIDTSVLIDALAVPANGVALRHQAAQQAVAVAVQNYQPVYSNDTFGELIQIMNLRGIGDRFGRENVHAFRKGYIGSAIHVPNVTQLDRGVIADEKDKPFLELAVSSGAQCILSSDKHFLSKKHLALAHMKPIQIWSPQQFLQYDLQQQRRLHFNRRFAP